jgi:hypothetical protein
MALSAASGRADQGGAALSERPTTEFGKNIPPVARASDPREIGKLKQSAARWLARNDPDFKKNKRIAKLRKKRAVRKTRVHRLK